MVTRLVILFGLILALLIAAFIGMGVISSGGASMSIAMLGVGLVLVLIPLLIWLAARLFVAVPVMADARSINPIYGLTQSWKLTRRHQWPIVGFVLLYIVAVLILQGVLGLVGAIFTLALGDVVGAILAGIIVALPVGIIGLAVAYGAYDRLRPDDAGDIFG